MTIKPKWPDYVDLRFIKSQNTTNPGGFGSWAHAYFGELTHGYNAGYGPDVSASFSISKRFEDWKSRMMTAQSAWQVGLGTPKTILNTRGRCFLPKLDLWIITYWNPNNGAWLTSSKEACLNTQTFDWNPNPQFRTNLEENLRLLSQDPKLLDPDASYIKIDDYPLYLERSGEKKPKSWQLRFSSFVNLNSLNHNKVKPNTMFNNLFEEAA